jgi:hypothetical protein
VADLTLNTKAALEQPWARDQVESAALWINVSDEMPDADTTVLVRCDHDEESYATAAYWSGRSYWSGHYWGAAIGTGPVRHVRAWMHMHDAMAALGKTRGEVARG